MKNNNKIIRTYQYFFFHFEMLKKSLREENNESIIKTAKYFVVSVYSAIFAGFIIERKFNLESIKDVLLTLSIVGTITIALINYLPKCYVKIKKNFDAKQPEIDKFSYSRYSSEIIGYYSILKGKIQDEKLLFVYTVEIMELLEEFLLALENSLTRYSVDAIKNNKDHTIVNGVSIKKLYSLYNLCSDMINEIEKNKYAKFFSTKISLLNEKNLSMYKDYFTHVQEKINES
jgi:hypothetical protein